MEKNEMFLEATRRKMRFPFRGLISVEDLWDLTVEQLDTVFKTLNGKVKQSKEESLLEKRTSADRELDLQIEIVKYIVSVKITEQEKQKKAKENKEQRQKILSILAEKQDAALQDKSVDELQKMLEDLAAEV